MNHNMSGEKFQNRAPRFTPEQAEYLREAFPLDLEDLSGEDGIAKARGREEVIGHIEALSRPKTEK